MIDIPLYINAANAGSNVTGIGVKLEDLQDFSVQVTFSSASLNGTLTLESSNDNTNYVTVAGSSQTVTSGAGHQYNVQGAAYRYFRLVWAFSSGTGTLSAHVVIDEAMPSKGA